MQNKINVFVSIFIVWLARGWSTPVGTTVTTQFGDVQGLEEDVCISYRGIPYGEIPQRWTAAVPITSFTSNPLIADSWGPMCWQSPCSASPGVCGDTISEDCLFLNIFVPKNTDSTSGLAVMIYIHGGGFEVYTGSSNIYHGCRLAEKGGVIVVTINYRLGIMHALYTGNTDADARGNYALTDQRLAINWVYDNIGDFGGNREQITLFGQSAGAQSILCHLMSKKIVHKFKQVIVQSASISIPFRTQEEALAQGDLVASGVGCTPRDLECLRGKSAVEIQQASNAVSASDFTDSLLMAFESFVPVIDGDEVTMRLDEFSNNPDLLGKPAILGTVDEEAILYVNSGFTSPLSSTEYTLMLVFLKGMATYLKLFPFYKSVNSDDARQELSELVTDFVFVCPTRFLAKNVKPDSNVWLYNFNHVLPAPGLWADATFCEGRACHGSEVPYVFQSFEKEDISMSEEEQIMSDSIIQYWTNFAKTGNPNPKISRLYAKLVYWPKYKKVLSNKHMTFQTPSNKVVRNFKNIRCNVWDSVNSYIARIHE